MAPTTYCNLLYVCIYDVDIAINSNSEYNTWNFSRRLYNVMIAVLITLKIKIDEYNPEMWLEKELHRDSYSLQNLIFFKARRGR